MRITAGLVVIYRESILLVRQYYDTKNNHLSIPKGEALKGENLLNAAIRETEEETGVKVPIEYIDPEPHLLNINMAKIRKKGVNSQNLVFFLILRLSPILLTDEKTDNLRVAAPCNNCALRPGESS